MVSLEIRLVELHVDELDESGQATYRSAVMKLAYLGARQTRVCITQ